MKLFKYFLIISVFIWVMLLFAILLSSCKVSKESNPSFRESKSKIFYKITPVDKDGKKGESRIIVG